MLSRRPRGRFPANNAEAGVPEPKYLIGKFITRIEVRAIPKGMEAVGENRTDLDRKYVPASCRGD